MNLMTYCSLSETHYEPNRLYVLGQCQLRDICCRLFNGLERSAVSVREKLGPDKMMDRSTKNDGFNRLYD